MEKLHRLREMSLDELRFRAAQQWRIQQEKMSLGKNGHGAATQAVPVAEFAARVAPKFFFSSADCRKIRAAYERHFASRIAEIRAEADAICAHRFRIFAYPEVQCGPEIPWRRDLVHGKDTGLEHWSTLPYLDFEKCGDSKIVWEPNRHQHFITLSQAFFLTGEEKYAEECLAQWGHWRRENPYPRGINWASSLEAAFRAWSWLWATHLLLGSRALNDSRLGEMTAALGEHAQYIANNLSTYFSPNTHLLGEGFALFAVGTVLPELPGADAWRETGRTILLEQMEKQVRADGSHIEQSSYYHRYATDMFLCAAVLANHNACAFPLSYLERLAHMCEFLQYTAWPSGGHPMIGDADGGRLLALEHHEPGVTNNDYRAALSTAAVFFRRGDFKFSAGALHEETLWLLGAEAASEFARLKAAVPAETSRAFRDAGTVAQRNEWSDHARALLFDAGPQGMGTCAHGHADALQVLCAADGIGWLVDPNTYGYTSSREWRDFFRGTRAHNTLAVDGCDQAEAVDFFKWRKIPAVQLEIAATLPRFDVAVAAHSGYTRLPEPVTHRRTVMFVKPDYWIVSDEVTGTGTHALEFFFHFAPGVKVESQHGAWLASKGGARFLLAPPAGVNISIVSGEESPAQGWVSRDYGHKEPAPVLIAQAQTALPARFHWLLCPSPAGWPRVRELPGPGLRLAVETDAWTTLVVVRGQQLDPDQGELWTDAEVAVLRRTKADEASRFVLVNGCCAESGGRALVRADSMFDELDALFEGEAAEIHARPARRFALHAPHARHARLNGKPAKFSRDGEWIEFKGKG
ncbi:MAG TPA: alginate lyase family protein [Candidatus Acidoferrales bacterium]|nr:alginate lyase family protein [Candidatus Acidoferrales bacterium]